MHKIVKPAGKKGPLQQTAANAASEHHLAALPAQFAQRSRLTGCLTRHFFTRTEDKQAVIETGEKPEGLNGRKPTMRIWKRVTSSRPPQNPIRVARKYEAFLQAGERSYADAAREFDVSRPTVCQYMALVQRLPADFVSWLEAQEDALILACFRKSRLMDIARLDTELAQRERLTVTARKLLGDEGDSEPVLAAVLHVIENGALSVAGKELRSISLDQQ